MNQMERVIEALEYRLEEMLYQSESLSVRCEEIKMQIMKIDLEYGRLKKDESAAKGCLKRISDGCIERTAAEWCRNILNNELDKISLDIETNRYFRMNLLNKQEELMMIVSDISEDIEAINGFVETVELEQ